VSGAVPGQSYQEIPYTLTYLKNNGVILTGDAERSQWR
jgi:hypothetical protein